MVPIQTLKILELTLVPNKLDPDLPQKVLHKEGYFEEHKLKNYSVKLDV